MKSITVEGVRRTWVSKSERVQERSELERRYLRVLR